MSNNNQIDIAAIQQLQQWADEAYLTIVACLTDFEHSENCLIVKGISECNCWRTRLQNLTRTFMAQTKDKNEENG